MFPDDYALTFVFEALMDLIDDLIYYTFRFAVSRHSTSLIWHEAWVRMEGAQYAVRGCYDCWARLK